MKMPINFAGHKVGFNRNVMCIRLDDDALEIKKVIVVNLASKITLTPTNDAATMLLYFLMKDYGNEIHFRDLKNAVEGRYDTAPRTPAEAVNDFLNEADDLYDLLRARQASQGASVPDPLRLYQPLSGTKPPWPGGPYFTQSTVREFGLNVTFGNPIVIIYRP